MPALVASSGAALLSVHDLCISQVSESPYLWERSGLRFWWRAKLPSLSLHCAALSWLLGDPLLPALIASSGGSLPLGSWGAQPACADEFSSSDCGIWISSETSSADPAVLFVEERGLARGYLSGLGEHGDR